MHQSARLNVFLGVSNLNAEFLPGASCAYLGSFFRSAPMNLLFPLSVTVSSTICCGPAVVSKPASISRSGSPPRATRLLATMMILAILEHWFLVLPISAAREVWNALNVANGA